MSKKTKIEIRSLNKPYEGRTYNEDAMIFEQEVYSGDIKEVIDLNKIKLTPENLLKIEESNKTAEMIIYYFFYKIYISSGLDRAYCIVGRYENENKPHSMLCGSDFIVIFENNNGNWLINKEIQTGDY